MRGRIECSKSDMIECSILSELEDKTGWKQNKTYSRCFHKSSSDDFPFQTVVTGEALR